MQQVQSIQSLLPLSLLDHLPSMMMLVDSQGRCLWANQATADCWQQQPDQLLELDWLKTIRGADQSELRAWLLSGGPRPLTCRIEREDQPICWLELELSQGLVEPQKLAKVGTVVDFQNLRQACEKDDPKYILRFLQIRDISEQHAVQAHLQASEARYALAAEAVRDGTWDWDLATHRVHLSPQGKRLIGCKSYDSIERIDDWLARVYAQDLHQFQADLAMHEAGVTPNLSIEHRVALEDGDIRWLHVRGRALRHDDGSVIRMIGSMSDVTERKLAEARLEHEATHDRLTGLPNRRLVTQRLAEAISRSHRVSGYEYAFMFLDFDRFKVINDSLGHDVGDQLLMSISRRLKGLIRANDMSARMGGDEFVVLLDGLETFESAVATAQRIQEAMSKPHQLTGHEVTSTVSIGIVFGDERYKSAEEVIRDADNAMYVAKTRGKDQAIVFDSGMHAQALRRLELEHGLRQACQRGEICSVYQPIVSLETGALRGFEALVRWQRDNGETVSPAEFVPIAEEIGVIQEIGEWVFQAACQKAVQWNRLVGEQTPITINVNVSRKQLMGPECIDRFREILDEEGCESEWIKIEITESTVADGHIDVLPMLKMIRDMGLALAMDDFGTGQSSLSCLHRFPLQVLKIDKSFVQDLAEHKVYIAIAEAIIALAHNLGFDVVAEGVETLAQLEILQGLACNNAQGYYFAPPLGEVEAEKYLVDAFALKKSA